MKHQNNTLFKCPSGHPILSWGLKYNSKISAGKYKKKKNSPGQGDFLQRFRDSIKLVATLAEMQSAREASHHLTLMDSCQTFNSHKSLGC